MATDEVLVRHSFAATAAQCGTGAAAALQTQLDPGQEYATAQVQRAYRSNVCALLQNLIACIKPDAPLDVW